MVICSQWEGLPPAGALVPAPPPPSGEEALAAWAGEGVDGWSKFIR